MFASAIVVLAALILSMSFYFYCPAHPPDLHSFPTRRSSDLHLAARPDHANRDLAAIGDKYLPKQDRKSTRLNSSHVSISYAVFCLKKKIQATLPLAVLALDKLADKIPTVLAIAAYVSPATMA